MFRERAVTAGELNDALIADRLAARSQHLLGDQTTARATIQRVLDNYIEPEGRANLTRFQYDQRISMRITLARTLWFTGSYDQAMREMKSVIEDAMALDHRLTLCVALADAACPLALMAGDLDSAESYIALLTDRTTSQFLDVWKAYADCYAGELVARTGRPLVGAAQMEKAIADMERSGFIQYRSTFVGSYAAALIDARLLDRAEATILDTLARGRDTGEAWYEPELLRLQGDVLMARTQIAAAIKPYRAALMLAQSQGARAWELRAASGLARALQAQGYNEEADSQLRAVVGSLTEGEAIADVVTARVLLRELASAA
jgi:tetratricopeptide (TPR) repeat protein